MLPLLNPEDYDRPVVMPKKFRCAICNAYWDEMEKAMACHMGKTCHVHDLIVTSNPNYLECSICEARCFRTSIEHLMEILDGIAL